MGSGQSPNGAKRQEYARAALKNGLVLSNKYGANPFKFGLVGGTDTHNALSTSDDENFYGKFVDSLPGEERTSSSLGDRLWDNWRLSASGYTAVWAKENTREAIFDALKRREVYATSGPRILLKFFGGWNYVQEDLEDPEFFNKTAYEDGVRLIQIVSRSLVLVSKYLKIPKAIILINFR